VLLGKENAAISSLRRPSIVDSSLSSAAFRQRMRLSMTALACLRATCPSEVMSLSNV